MVLEIKGKICQIEHSTCHYSPVTKYRFKLAQQFYQIWIEITNSLQSFDVWRDSRYPVNSVDQTVFLNEGRALGQDVRDVVPVGQVQLIDVTPEHATTIAQRALRRKTRGNFFVSEINKASTPGYRWAV